MNFAFSRSLAEWKCDRACERHREQPIEGKQVSNPDRIGLSSPCMRGQKFVIDFMHKYGEREIAIVIYGPARLTSIHHASTLHMQCLNLYIADSYMRGIGSEARVVDEQGFFWLVFTSPWQLNVVACMHA